MRISEKGFIDYEIPQQDNMYQYQQEQPQEYYDQDAPQGMPMYPPQQFGQAIYPSQDTGFLKWLFDFRKEAIIPLRNVWRGREFDFNEQKWDTNSASKLRIMNEDGITWGISLIESYMNPAFIVTDLDDITYKFRMREAVKVIWNSLSLRYHEFGLKKPDIPRVAEEIESKISAILRGALDNGYRDFFSTQNQNIETKNLTPMTQGQSPSMWSKLANSFKRNNGGGQYG